MIKKYWSDVYWTKALKDEEVKLELASDRLSVSQQQRMQVFKGRERFRAETPASHLNLFWVGDRPAESFLPEGTNPHLMEHWEMLARSLEERSVHPFVVTTCLHISEWTVSTHLRRIFAKLGVDSRAAMVYRYSSLLNDLEQLIV